MALRLTTLPRSTHAAVGHNLPTLKFVGNDVQPTGRYDPAWQSFIQVAPRSTRPPQENEAHSLERKLGQWDVILGGVLIVGGALYATTRERDPAKREKLLLRSGSICGFGAGIVVLGGSFLAYASETFRPLTGALMALASIPFVMAWGLMKASRK